MEHSKQYIECRDEIELLSIVKAGVKVQHVAALIEMSLTVGQGELVEHHLHLELGQCQSREGWSGGGDSELR